MPDIPQQSPLRAVMAIRREELPLAWRMSGYFFLVITTFWILKPIKKALFIEYYDDRAFGLAGLMLGAAQVELIAKVLNMFVAFVAVIVFSLLSRRFQRQRLSHVFTGFFAVTFVLYAALLRDPGAATVWTFYLYGDLFSTLMVATFFSFLSDSLSADAAKRVYGLVVLGGVLGGVVGSSFVQNWIDEMPTHAWLWVCLANAAIIAVLAQGAGRRAMPVPEEQPASRESDEAAAHTGAAAAVEGIRLVARSRYLLSIVVIVGVYEIVSTIMDFQFSSSVAHYLDGPEIGRHLSKVFLITNIVSLIVQLFLTGWIMNRLGMTIALFALPLMALGSSASFMVFPTLLFGSALNTADNGFSYSINQSAKEALYTLTTRREKYRAKAFIDMFVQRFAKAIAVGVSLAITTTVQDFSSVRWLSLITIVLGALWIVAVRYAGRRFDQQTRAEAP